VAHPIPQAAQVLGFAAVKPNSAAQAVQTVAEEHSVQFPAPVRSVGHTMQVAKESAEKNPALQAVQVAFAAAQAPQFAIVQASQSPDSTLWPAAQAVQMAAPAGHVVHSRPVAPVQAVQAPSSVVIGANPSLQVVQVPAPEAAVQTPQLSPQTVHADSLANSPVGQFAQRPLTSPLVPEQVWHAVAEVHEAQSVGQAAQSVKSAAALKLAAAHEEQTAASSPVHPPHLASLAGAVQA